MREYTLEDSKNLNNPLHCAPKSPEIELPWSNGKQWSLVILDEGAPIPHIGHTRYNWNVSAHGFMKHHLARAPEVDQLNAAKLRRLMERYVGRLTDVATLADGTAVNRLNFETLERLDVLVGLLDYTTLGPEYVKRLCSLYGACPLKPLGDRVRLSELRRLHADLRGATHSGAEAGQAGGEGE